MEKEFMSKLYHEKSVADSYIIGFTYKTKLYAIKLPHIDENVLNLEKASRNQGTNLRLRIRKLDKIDYINRGAIVIGKETDLLDSKWNKGEVFEKIITEKFGQTWVKDTVPFWKDGDITVNGEKIQIKLDSATLVSTKTLEKLN